MSVEFALRQQSVGKQLKLAAARPARCAVLIGPDERAAGVAIVRDLETGDESRVAQAELVDAVAARAPREGGRTAARDRAASGTADR